MVLGIKNRSFYELSPPCSISQKLGNRVSFVVLFVKEIFEKAIRGSSFARNLAQRHPHPFAFLAQNNRLEEGEVILGAIPLLKRMHPDRFRLMHFDEVGVAHRFVVAPILMRTGKKGRHWVVALYDCEHRGRVEFYDSGGKTYAERLKKDRTIQEIMQRFIQEVEPGAPQRVGVVSNRKRHQQDRVNCGVYLLRYIDLRCAGLSAEQISQTSCGFFGILKYRRSLLAQARQFQLIP